MTRSPQAAGSAPRGVLIRAMKPANAGQVLAIYQAGLDQGRPASRPPPRRGRHFDAGKLPDHRFVAVDTDRALVGWVAVSPTSARAVYAGVVEHSVYIDPAAQGHRRRSTAADALIVSTEAAGIWSIQSGVFPENTASLTLHQRAGFRIIGTRERVGRHHGRWRDTVLIERRSALAGAG